MINKNQKKPKGKKTKSSIEKKITPNLRIFDKTTKFVDANPSDRLSISIVKMIESETKYFTDLSDYQFLLDAVVIAWNYSAISKRMEKHLLFPLSFESFCGSLKAEKKATIKLPDFISKQMGKPLPLESLWESLKAEKNPIKLLEFVCKQMGKSLPFESLWGSLKQRKRCPLS
ncbi:MAG: hypothetical protein LBV67_01530 [Streptococcaceae bacterium]|jgi:hypothetical protein|nr:hypothetical protein [Streptococcaceae bacterium]